MTSNHHTVYEATYDVIPTRWFEQRHYLFALCCVVSLIVLLIQSLAGVLNSVPLSVVAVVLYTLGFAADTLITHAVFLMKTQFDAAGIVFPIAETSLFLPKTPKLKDHFFSVSSILVAVLLPFAYLLPSFGFGVFALRIGAVMANLRHQKRLTRMLQTHGNAH